MKKSAENNIYQTFRRMRIRHGDIGFDVRGGGCAYYCTPRGAEILGWAGVDGVHYCRIPEFGEMIFSVDPTDFGDCVHPIAKSFEDLLCLLLSCGDMAAIAQCHLWDRGQYEAFLAENPITENQKKVLDRLKSAFDLQPMDDAFGYIKELQAGFDLAMIPYTEEYYDIDMNPAAAEEFRNRPFVWGVTYGGGFDEAAGVWGEEIPVGKAFSWQGESWLIPAVYRCEEGLVVDIFTAVEAETVFAFLKKWDLSVGAEPKDEAFAVRVRADDPMGIDFRGRLRCGGVQLREERGFCISYLPESLVFFGGEPSREARAAVEHYQLDEGKVWVMHRISYRRQEGSVQTLDDLSVELIQSPKAFFGDPIRLSSVGEKAVLTHPKSGEQYTLCVKELEPTEIPEQSFGRGKMEMECPTHAVSLCYTLEPELPAAEFVLRDCSRGDTPRMKKQDENAFAPVMTAAVGIIGGADGPTAVIGGNACGHASCSSLYFAPPADICWQPVFYVKEHEDLQVRII